MRLQREIEVKISVYLVLLVICGGVIYPNLYNNNEKSRCVGPKINS